MIEATLPPDLSEYSRVPYKVVQRKVTGILGTADKPQQEGISEHIRHRLEASPHPSESSRTQVTSFVSQPEVLLRKIVESKHEAELEEILDRRSELLSAKYDRGLTEAEQQELSHVEWRLDVVNYARSLPDIEKMESTLSEARSLTTRIDRLIDELRHR